MMKQLIILVTILLSSLYGYPIDKNYFTHEEFVKIKSYFTDKEQGCAGIERFLQSSKDLHVSDEWYPDEDYNGDSRKLKDLPYQKLCLLAGSTDVTFYAYVDLSKSGAEYIKNKNYWINQFPKDKKIVSIEFSLSNEITKKCYKNIAPYAVVYEKRENGVFERHFEFNNIQDGYKSDYNCILRQLNIFKANPRIGIITNVQNNTKKDVMVRDSLYEDGGQWDRINIGQKVRILGSVSKYSYVYYNKKIKGVCDPLKFIDGCNSGWVNINSIAEDK